MIAFGSLVFPPGCFQKFDNGFNFFRHIIKIFRCETLCKSNYNSITTQIFRQKNSKKSVFFLILGQKSPHSRNHGDTKFF